MKSKRQQIREQLEAGLAVYLASGKEITQIDAIEPGKRKPRKTEDVVYIQVEHLPESLAKKHFPEG